MLPPPPTPTLFPYTTLFRSERARASWKGGEKGAIAPAYQELLAKGRTKFLGYNQMDAVSTAVGLLVRSEEHTSELQSRGHLVCRLLLEKKNKSELANDGEFY